MSDEEDWEDYKREAQLEVQEEVAFQNILLLDGVKLVEFVSNSKGRGRKRKRPKEVLFVEWRGKVVSLGNKLTTKIQYLMENIFPETMAENDWLEAFKEALRESKRMQDRLKR